MTYDVIGDLHGHATELRTLLAQLGYEERNGVYVAQGRKAIFVGDFVDRGPAIREVLQIARAMISRDAAHAVLGNHEFNALCYHTADGAGTFLRPHSPKYVHQHQATLDQLVVPCPEEWQSYLQWFKDLPLFLEIDGLRVVHAAWDKNAIRLVRGRSFHDPHFLAAAATKGTPEFTAVETLLKGPEIKLPDGQTSVDKDGTERADMRVAWWQSRKRKRRLKYCDIAVPSAVDMPEMAVPSEVLSSLPSYGRSEPPVIFGHYWFVPSTPQILERNVACIDYSVAKDGFLAAYSWSGEKQLNPKHFTIAMPD
jgi:calcineurin-like phosphoesterase family protein